MSDESPDDDGSGLLLGVSMPEVHANLCKLNPLWRIVLENKPASGVWKRQRSASFSLPWWPSHASVTVRVWSDIDNTASRGKLLIQFREHERGFSARRGAQALAADMHRLLLNLAPETMQPPSSVG